MSARDDSIPSPIQASSTFNEPTETNTVQHLIANLGLKTHPEGGYFVETDRDPLRVPNPFLLHDQGNPLPPPPLPPLDQQQQSAGQRNEDNSTRSACTSIYYLLTPASPKGNFHRNKGRTIHTLHQGRGQYVIIHADGVQKGEKARVETFVVGHNIQKGEKLQWVVEGGKYKASFLLSDIEGSSESEGLLISEVMRKPSLYFVSLHHPNLVDHHLSMLIFILDCRTGLWVPWSRFYDSRQAQRFGVHQAAWWALLAPVTTQHIARFRREIWSAIHPPEKKRRGKLRAFFRKWIVGLSSIWVPNRKMYLGTQFLTKNNHRSW